MSAMSASPGMTRIRPNTISEESRRTGTARSSRRSTYLYIGGGGLGSPLQFLSPHRPRPHGASDLLIQPQPRGGRRPVAIGATERERGHVSQMRLVKEEAGVVRHPHP